MHAGVLLDSDVALRTDRLPGTARQDRAGCGAHELIRVKHKRKAPPKRGLSMQHDALDQNLYCAETPYRLAAPSNGPTSVEPPEVMSIFGEFGSMRV